MLLQRKILLSSSSRLAIVLLVPAMTAYSGSPAFAGCATLGGVTTCTSGSPNPWTNTVGTGRANNNATVEVSSSATISAGNKNAISVGNNAIINVRDGATVTNNATFGSGLFGTGLNTIEFGSNGHLLVEAGGKVVETGTLGSAEAVNVHGYGNVITNYGLISGQSSAAIWFQDEVSGTRNVVDNYGTIEKRGGSGSVIGTSAGSGIVFYNRSDAEVLGSLSFSGGNDDLYFEANSLVTGNINGGGGTNRLILQGETGSSDTLAGNIANFSTLTKDGEGLWTVSGSLSGFTLVTVKDGTLALTGDNTGYTGNVVVDPTGALEARAQSLPVKPTTSGNVENVQNNGLVRFTQPDDGTYVGQITGTGGVEKVDAGILTLDPVAEDGNTYTGGTSINGGTVAVARDNALGDAAGGLTFDGGTLRFNDSFDLSGARAVLLSAGGGTFDTNGFATTVGQAITGGGGLTKTGAGTLNLEGANAYSGPTVVTGGALYVNGDQSSARGTTSVGTGATLGGVGTVGGDVNVADGGTLAPGLEGAAPGTLTVNGDLSLSGGSVLDYSFGQADVVGGPLNDHTIVHGDLVLDGTIDVTAAPGSSFEPGIYRVISYDGGLTNNGLEIGTIPAAGYYVQTSVANQVNLVNTSGLTLNFWDGDAGPKNSSTVDGGDGTWQNASGNDNWTEQNGAVNAPFADGAFAIFMGAAGTVDVDNSLGNVAVSGMQFASDGYRIQGDAVTLAGDSATIRVGDGTAAGADITTTIASELTGDSRLVKTDLGTLILEEANSYTGGTVIDGGTVQISGNENLGAASGSVSFNGGTLHTTSGFGIDRSTELQEGGGAIDTDAGTTLTYEGAVNGAGSLTKVGGGTLVLDGQNSYEGGTAINDGVVQIGANANLGAVDGTLGIDGGTLHSTADVEMDRATTLGPNDATIDTVGDTTLTQAGGINGPGSLTKAGGGTLVLTGDGTHAGGTTIADGTLQLGNGGVSGSILGDVVNNGMLAFDRADEVTFDGAISGTGGVRQIGGGTTVLNGQGTYSGITGVEAGTLAAGTADIFSSSSAFDVAGGAILDLRDHDQIVASLANAGTVDLGNKAGTVLSVAGDYTGNGGTLRINTVLGDDNSVTDRLAIAGNTSGTGILSVTNVGGAGAPTREGIRVVSVDGASNGMFTLLGDYDFQGRSAVIGGAYAYQLYQGGVANPADGDWYLRSQLVDPDEPEEPGEPEDPIYQPGVPVYEAYPQVLLALNGLPTLQQRVGNRYWSGVGGVMVEQGDGPGMPHNSSGLIEQRALWGRVEGTHMRADPSVSTSDTDYTADIWKMQAGLDGQLHESQAGMLIGGVTVHYARADATARSVYGDGEIDTDGYGLGATLTWYGTDGLYVDGQAQATWYDTDLSSTLANVGLSNGNDGFGYAFSLETGKRMMLDNGWTLTPQAQLVYSAVDFDSFEDVWGTPISRRDGDSLKGRLGVSLDREQVWQGEQGTISRSHVYGIANLYYEFLDGTAVDVAGVGFASRDQRLWGGLGLGGSYNWADDKYSIYGEGSINTGLAHFADSYSLVGTVGLRVKF